MDFDVNCAKYGLSFAKDIVTTGRCIYFAQILACDYIQHEGELSSDESEEFCGPRKKNNV